MSILGFLALVIALLVAAMIAIELFDSSSELKNNDQSYDRYYSSGLLCRQGMRRESGATPTTMDPSVSSSACRGFGGIVTHVDLSLHSKALISARSGIPSPSHQYQES